MKINWKIRFQNKVWLTSFIALVLSFIYTLLGKLNIQPVITQNEVGEIVSQLLLILGMLGVIVDPTTEGVNDSNRAMSYAKPWNDETDNDDPNG